ncbi:MAG TPA: hypothetical protein VGX03_32215, partial [Candidatus Binatia bacterium]|nr:hypothetical protein [Candidatus Binatia bacterium]
RPDKVVKELEIRRNEKEMGPLPDTSKDPDRIAAFRLNLLYTVLHYLHRQARTSITQLLETGRITTVKPETLQTTVITLHSDGTVEERPQTLDLLVLLLFDLAQLIRRSPFPFRRCAFSPCGRIFVRKKRQRYCCRVCTGRGNEAARKGKRRQYMREFMEKKRKREKAQQQAAWKAR